MTVRVVVVGGGYAGLAALTALRAHLPSARLTLVDSDPAHLKLTRLHEAASRPLAELQVPFRELAARLRFEHVRGRAGTDGTFDADALEAWQTAGELPVTVTAPSPIDGAASQAVPFDYLVLTTGGQPLIPVSPEDREAVPRRVLSLAELRSLELRLLLRERVEEHRRSARPGPFRLSIIGAGATGVQYAFEVNEALRRLGAPGAVRVLDLTPAPLSDMPSSVQQYVAQRLRAAGIAWLPGTRFIGQIDDAIRLGPATGDGSAYSEEPSSLTLLLGGAAPSPFPLCANRFGQIIVDGRRLERVFAAGDCARFDASGANAANAQVALRQGKHVAINVSRSYRRRELLPYVFEELGYVVSLGVVDAAGWVLMRSNVVTGMPAVALKAAVDTQYDLFLQGIDTYVI